MSTFVRTKRAAPQRHYAHKAARAFLAGTSFRSPHEAIEAGARSENDWQTFMLGFAARFWRENGAKARSAVKKRHPVVAARPIGGELQSAEICSKKLRRDVLALEERARDWATVGGPGRAGLDRSALAAYELWLDVVRHGVTGDFPGWLSRHSGISYDTCRRRMRAGMALNLGINPRMNHSGLLLELRDRETSGNAGAAPWLDEDDN